MQPSKSQVFTHVLALELLQLYHLTLHTLQEILTDIMSRPQFSRLNKLNLHMHGLIFETSEWLPAESTGLPFFCFCFFSFFKEKQLSHNQIATKTTTF